MSRPLIWPLPSRGCGPGLRVRNQFAITCLVLFRHPRGGEPLREAGPNSLSVETREFPDGSDGVFLTIDDEAGHAVLDYLRNGAGAVGDHRRPARHYAGATPRQDAPRSS